MTSPLETVRGLLEAQHAAAGVRVEIDGDRLVGHVGERKVASVATDRVFKVARGSKGALLLHIQQEFRRQVEAGRAERPA